MALLGRDASIAVIGAGVSGLAMARMLLGEGFECVVLERSQRIGGVWADGYAGFGVQVPRDLYEFPDWPLPADAENFTPGPVFRAYLEDYARAFSIFPRIRFGTEVLEITPATPTGRWLVRFRDGNATTSAIFDLVVVCTGMFSAEPCVPVVPGADGFAGQVIHSSAFRSRRQAQGRKVVVVGYGKSATDAALQCAAVAAETTLLVRTPYWPVPRKLLGVLPFQWGLLTRLTAALVPLYQRPSPLEQHLHRLGGRVPWLFWRAVETLVRVQCRLASAGGEGNSLVPGLPVELSAFRETTMVPRPALYRLIRAGDIRLKRGGIARFDARHVVLGDGASVDADLVIMATGWRTSFPFFPHSVRDALDFGTDGLYLYRHLLHPRLPGLAFVGCNAVTYQAILTSTLQARWLVELLKGTHELPCGDAMREEIDAMRAWKRSWMPETPARGAMVGLHQQHYHDELLRDMGIDPKRKRGALAPLKELLVPYVCRDYARVADRSGSGDA